MSSSSGNFSVFGEDRRTEARERALSLLYEAEAKGYDADQVLGELAVPADPMAELLVRGVFTHMARIDFLITSYAKGWTLDRMPVIDRSVLRIATFELIERPDVPTAVILDEAVELAKQFSTDDSGRFVNGLLASIARATR